MTGLPALLVAPIREEHPLVVVNFAEAAVELAAELAILALYECEGAPDA